MNKNMNMDIDMNNIIETLQAEGQYNRFLRIISSGNYGNILQGRGPFTVLAPIDDAFENLPQDEWEKTVKNQAELSDIISQHIIIGNLSLIALGEMDEVVTLENTNLAVENHNEGIIVGGARIVQGDIFCSNGVIHGIDLVLLP